MPISSSSSLSPSLVMLSLLLVMLQLLTVAYGWHIPSDGTYVSKKSEQPQWEDLGWAWGKRAAPAVEPTANWEDLGWAWGKRSGSGSGTAPRRAREASLSGANRVLRSMAKQNPDWHDLGWAWGKRK